MCTFCVKHGEGKRWHLKGCWGCGTCRAHCARAALALKPRAAAPDVAGRW